MYADERRIRKHRIPVNVDDFNNELLESIAAETGKQKTSVAHVLLNLMLRELNENRSQLEKVIELLA